MLLTNSGSSENDPPKGLIRVDSNNSMSSSITLDSDRSYTSKGNNYNNYNNNYDNNQKDLKKEKEREKELLLKINLESLEKELKVRIILIEY